MKQMTIGPITYVAKTDEGKRILEVLKYRIAKEVWNEIYETPEWEKHITITAADNESLKINIDFKKEIELNG